MKRLFVTGTDTGAGKTFVTAALARRARELGRKVFAYKPIETGCERVGGHLVGPDQEIISTAAGGWQTGPQRGVYQFVNAVAPLVASELEHSPIDLNLIAKVANSETSVDLLIVEGAGGWRVPITTTADMAVLARQLETKVVVVARAGLGTINHSLLTVEAVERDGCSVAAVVLSRRPDEDASFAQSNRDQIHRRWPGPVLVFDTNTRVLDPLLG